MLSALDNDLLKSAAAAEASEREDTARKTALHSQKVSHDFNQQVVLPQDRHRISQNLWTPLAAEGQEYLIRS